MATKTVTFTHFHPAFSDSDDIGVPKELDAEAAQKAIDLGIAFAGKGASKERADASPAVNQTTSQPVVSNAAVNASVKQRELAQGIHDEVMEVGNDEIQGTLPVGTTADGQKVLIKPADNELNQTSAPGVPVVAKKGK